MAIPKIIHYCWLSGEPYPEKVQRCIDSWKRILPDYEIKLWDINSFDFDSLLYTKQALAKKQYAFVSDVIRLYAVYTEGGIYLDSDVEVYKPFDDLLVNRAFMGFECTGKLGPWLIGGEAGNSVIKELLDYYNEKSFIKPDGSMDKVANTVPVTKALYGHGLKLENVVQYLDGITIYPDDYFCPKSYWSDDIDCTENTYCAHLFEGAWNENAKVDVPFVAAVPAMIAEFLRDNPAVAAGAEQVIIYGTGDVGVYVYRQLRKQCPAVRIGSFMVTSNTNPWDMLYGLPIVEIGAADEEQKGAVVITATTPKYHNAIVNSLREHYFRKIFCLKIVVA